MHNVVQLLRVSSELEHANELMERGVGVKKNGVGPNSTYEKQPRAAPHSCTAVDHNVVQLLEVSGELESETRLSETPVLIHTKMSLDGPPWRKSPRTAPGACGAVMYNVVELLRVSSAIIRTNELIEIGVGVKKYGVSIQLTRNNRVPRHIQIQLLYTLFPSCWK